MERYYVVPPIRILTGTKYLSSVSNPLILLFSTSTHVSANLDVYKRQVQNVRHAYLLLPKGHLLSPAPAPAVHLS